MEQPRTIDWRDGVIEIIDQRSLPGDLRSIEIREVDDLVTAIRSLAVRGAMALGVAGAMGVALAAVRASEGRHRRSARRSRGGGRAWIHA